MTCPPGCICQGLAFTCSNIFNTSFYPELRYLNAGGSLLQPLQLSQNVLVILLNLTKCQLLRTTMHIPSLPNLLILDLSWNLIDFINMDSFGVLTNLDSLLLSNNPITLFTSETDFSNKKITSVDLSSTRLKVLQTRALTCCQNLRNINLRNTPIQSIQQSVFFTNSLIEVLDFRFDSDIVHSPNDLLIGLRNLDEVKTTDFRLCCPVMLPKGFNYNNCR